MRKRRNTCERSVAFGVNGLLLLIDGFSFQILRVAKSNGIQFTWYFTFAHMFMGRAEAGLSPVYI